MHSPASALVTQTPRNLRHKSRLSLTISLIFYRLQPYTNSPPSRGLCRRPRSCAPASRILASFYRKSTTSIAASSKTVGQTSNQPPINALVQPQNHHRPFYRENACGQTPLLAAWLDIDDQVAHSKCIGHWLNKGLMKKTTLIGFVFAFALWLCAPSITFGQAVYGSIVGTVRDTSGASVPNAKVTVLDVAKGVAHGTTTNDTGNYSQTHLIVGVYEVRVEAPSFETFVQRNVTVEVDSTTQVNAQLVVGKVGEVVNVTAEAPLLKTTRSDVSDTFTQKSVVELPVFARDINRLYFLVPGVQASSTTAASEQP